MTRVIGYPTAFTVNGATGIGMANYPISVPGTFANSYAINAGGLNIQPLAQDNIIIANNMIYSTTSSNYKYSTSSTGESINMGGGQIVMNTYKSGTAGGVPAIGSTITNFYGDNTGVTKIGLNPSNSAFSLWATPNNIKISAAILHTGVSGDSVLVWHAADSSLYAVAQSSLGGGTPGGSTNDLQFNVSGTFTGGGPTYVSSTGVLSASKAIAAQMGFKATNTTAAGGVYAQLVGDTYTTSAYQYGTTASPYGAIVAGAGAFYTSSPHLVLMADNAAGEIDFATGSTPSAQVKILTGGALQAPHYGGNGSAPTTSSLGTNVTSATVTGGGTDDCFILTIVASGAVSGTVCVITYATAWASTPKPFISCVGNTVSNTQQPLGIGGSTTSTATIQGALTGAGTYTYTVTTRQ